jgi:hypothetical protein
VLRGKEVRILLKVKLLFTTEFFSPPMVQQPLVGQGLLIIEASLSHSDTPHWVLILWTSDQPDAETSTCSQKTYIHSPEDFEPTIPATERPQTYALDRAASGIRSLGNIHRKYFFNI